MTARQPLTLAQAHALAQACLLDHLRRRDPAHALGLLVRSLANATGAACRLEAVPPAGLAPAPAIEAHPVAGPADPATPPVWMTWPLVDLGVRVGYLHLGTPDGPVPPDWTARIDPLLESAGALLGEWFAPADPAFGHRYARTRTAMHEAGTFVWEWDIATDVLSDIDEGELMLGYPDNTLGHTQDDWNRLIHPDDADAVEAAYQAHVRGEEPLYRAVYRARGADGGWRWVEERGRIVEWDDSGNPRRMFGTQADATLLHELEVARRDRLAAQAADAAKTLFLSRVSHELRTPLNAVIGFAQLLDTDPLLVDCVPQRRQLQHIREAGEHLMRMITDLLDLSLAEASHLPVALQAVPLAPLLEGCADWIRPQADAAQVRVILPPPPAGAVRADPTRLRQVLMNLLGNAVKYNRAGGRVNLRATALEGQWRIEVEDTGEGISATRQAGLFQPFNRLGRESGDVAGTGIGLALSQSLAQRMGGQITVQSTPGVGSIFSLTLPQA